MNGTHRHGRRAATLAALTLGLGVLTTTLFASSAAAATCGTPDCTYAATAGTGLANAGITLFASSGDTGYGDTQDLGYSPDTVIVGGADLSQPAPAGDPNNHSLQAGVPFTAAYPGTGAYSPGSGCLALDDASLTVPWRPDTPNCTGQNRAGVDIAASFSTFTFVHAGRWEGGAGTSLATPIAAALAAMVTPPTTGDVPTAEALALRGASSDRDSFFYDVTDGSNYCAPADSSDPFALPDCSTSAGRAHCGLLCTAAPGWDGITGSGVPSTPNAFAPMSQSEANTRLGTIASSDWTVTGKLVGSTSGWVGTPLNLAVAGSTYPLPVASYAITWGSSNHLGLGFDTSTGRFTGTPTASGTVSGSVVVRDSAGHSSTPVAFKVSIARHVLSVKTGAIRVGSRTVSSLSAGQKATVAVGLVDTAARSAAVSTSTVRTSYTWQLVKSGHATRTVSHAASVTYPKKVTKPTSKQTKASKVSYATAKKKHYIKTRAQWTKAKAVVKAWNSTAGHAYRTWLTYKGGHLKLTVTVSRSYWASASKVVQVTLR